MPEGFTRFEEDGVSISYPESWRELPDPDADQNVVLLARELGRPGVEAARVTLTRVDEEAPFSSLMTNIKVFNRNQLENASFVDDGLAVEYPASWVPDEEREGGEAGVEISVHGRRDEDGLFPRLLVSRKEKEFAGAPQAGGVLADLRPFQLNDWRAVSDKRASVPGADGAWRVVTRYTNRARRRREGAGALGRGDRVEGRRADPHYAGRSPPNAWSSCPWSGSRARPT